MSDPIRQFTATAIVVHNNQTLLMWHKRLQRWMPPGGHLDPNELPEEAAIRECKEETGLNIEILSEWEWNVFAGHEDEGRMQKKPIATLIEQIPASKERNEPAHQHMDFVFLGTLAHENQLLQPQLAEMTALRWFSRSEIFDLQTESEIYGNVQRLLLHILDE